MRIGDVKYFLDEKVALYNRPDFISGDPIEVPHRYSKKQDIEIAGFFAALLAWGKRSVIIKKAYDLMQRMDNSPHDFILHHTPGDLPPIEKFKHRTFNGLDCLYCVHFLHTFYKQNTSLENAFRVKKNDATVERGLIQFHKLFFEHECAPLRTQKHVPSPIKKSACKKLNLFLRWMVRKDNKGVDFGLWKKIRPDQLIIPCDVHVGRVAHKLNLISEKPINWKTALNLTGKLKKFDPADPVKYDFALFGLGIKHED